jgi:hypothetical protein
MRRIVRMLSLHAVETTQHRYGPKANEPDQGRHQPQPLQPGSLRRPGRREPDSGSRSIRPHPYLIVGKASLRSRNSMNVGNTAAALLVGNTQAITGSSSNADRQRQR